MLSNINILYVEDNVDISEEIAFFLTKKVNKIETARNGEEALALYKKSKPDLIITDIMMPKLNGLEMIQIIREQDTKIPIIITSAFNETQKLLDSIELGVDAYILKPIQMKKLLEKIEQLMRATLLEKQLQERAIAETSFKYQKLLELSTNISALVFWEFDFTTQKFIFNDIYYKFFATSIELEGSYEMEFESYLEHFVPKKEHENFRKMLAGLYEKEEENPYRYEYNAKRRDGKLIPVIVDCYITYSEDKKPLKGYGTKFNIKQQKEREVELYMAKERVQSLVDEQNILLSLFDTGSSIILKCKNDTNLTLEYISNSVEGLLGYNKQELLSSGKSFCSHMHPDDYQRFEKEREKILQEGKESLVHAEYRMLTKENKVKYVSQSISTVKNDSGEITDFIAHIIDITEIRTSQQKIKKHLTLIDENIISSSTNLEGKITDISKAFTTFTGYAKEELVGEVDCILRDAHCPNCMEIWKSLKACKTWRGELQNRKKDGTPYWVNATVFPVHNEEFVKTGYLSIFHDISDKKKVEKLSITDELTTLYNRRHFNSVFEKELQRSHRDHKSIAFVMLDVDNFKDYNDTYGHQQGDEVLEAISKIFKEYANRVDDAAFRLGGEEFGLLLSSKDEESTQKHIESLLQAVEDLKIEHMKNSASDFVTVSAGIAFYKHSTAIDSRALYRNADAALYLAKERGRNQQVTSKE